MTSAATTATSTRAVAVPPWPLPTWYSIGGSRPVAVAGTVTWMALPPATMATEPTAAGSGVTPSITTEVQSTLGSLSSTRSTVARPALTPNSSSTACGTPIWTAVQSGGSRGRSSLLLAGRRRWQLSSVGPSGGATSAQLSTLR